MEITTGNTLTEADAAAAHSRLIDAEEASALPPVRILTPAEWAAYRNGDDA